MILPSRLKIMKRAWTRWEASFWGLSLMKVSASSIRKVLISELLRCLLFSRWPFFGARTTLCQKRRKHLQNLNFTNMTKNMKTAPTETVITAELRSVPEVWGAFSLTFSGRGSGHYSLMWREEERKIFTCGTRLPISFFSAGERFLKRHGFEVVSGYAYASESHRLLSREESVTTEVQIFKKTSRHPELLLNRHFFLEFRRELFQLGRRLGICQVCGNSMSDILPHELYYSPDSYELECYP